MRLTHSPDHTQAVGSSCLPSRQKAQTAQMVSFLSHVKFTVTVLNLWLDLVSRVL